MLQTRISKKLGSAAVFIAAAFTFAPFGLAQAQCAFGAWTSLAGATVAANLGDDRYQGQCGYMPNQAGSPLVHELGAGNETSSIAVSAYAFVDGGTAEVYKALDGATEILSLSVNDGTSQATLTTPAGNVSGPINVPETFYRGGWNHYKILWNSGGNAELIINGTSAGTAGGGSGSIDTQQFGFISGNATNTKFDDFKSFRTDDPDQTRPGCPGDADSNGFRNVLDAVRVLRDGSPGIETPGFPQANGDLFFNVLDAVTLLIAGNCPA